LVGAPYQNRPICYEIVPTWIKLLEAYLNCYEVY